MDVDLIGKTLEIDLNCWHNIGKVEFICWQKTWKINFNYWHNTGKVDFNYGQTLEIWTLIIGLWLLTLLITYKTLGKWTLIFINHWWMDFNYWHNTWKVALIIDINIDNVLFNYWHNTGKWTLTSDKILKNWTFFTDIMLESGL